MKDKELTRRGLERFNDKHHYNWLGKKINTMGFGNWLWIHTYEKGIKLKKRYEGTIVLNKNDLQIICGEFAGEMGFFNKHDLKAIGCKTTGTKEFINRLIDGKVTLEEKQAIINGYNTRVKMMEAL
jgi:ATP-dependent RNA circularization protein (DNA/RNA ligase family)